MVGVDVRPQVRAGVTTLEVCWCSPELSRRSGTPTRLGESVVLARVPSHPADDLRKASSKEEGCVETSILQIIVWQGEMSLLCLQVPPLPRPG